MMCSWWLQAAGMWQMEPERAKVLGEGRAGRGEACRIRLTMLLLSTPILTIGRAWEESVCRV